MIGTLAFAFLLLVVPAALAAGGNEKPEKAAQSSENSNAADNASKGMNRESGPGEWKENGHEPSANSAPQGRSPSDPDSTGNGGLDKPGETGGFSADRDGNNGCGNDDDREDDNNGWCGNKPVSTPAPRVSPTVVTSPTETPAAPRVLGKRVVAEEAPQVLGLLPRTGLALAGIMVVSGGLLGAGAALRRLTKTCR